MNTRQSIRAMMQSRPAVGWSYHDLACAAQVRANELAAGLLRGQRISYEDMDDLDEMTMRALYDAVRARGDEIWDDGSGYVVTAAR